MKKLQNQQSGFTIIEVLIVLAIAGLIMLIVFLAVPALQRNSRNTQIKNDVATVIGGVNEYASNNNGSLPGVICTDTATGTVRAVASGTCTTTGASASPEIAKVRGGVGVSNGTAMPTATNTITVYLNRTCNGTAFASAATTRAFAAGFLVETSGGTSTQCQES